MTTDNLGFVTEASDPTLYATLLAMWRGERKPGYVVKGSVHYKVYVENDVPKFYLKDNEQMYNSRSMGG